MEGVDVFHWVVKSLRKAKCRQSGQNCRGGLPPSWALVLARTYAAPHRTGPARHVEAPRPSGGGHWGRTGVVDQRSPSSTAILSKPIRRVGLGAGALVDRELILQVLQLFEERVVAVGTDQHGSWMAMTNHDDIFFTCLAKELAQASLRFSYGHERRHFLL